MLRGELCHNEKIAGLFVLVILYKFAGYSLTPVLRNSIQVSARNRQRSSMHTSHHVFMMYLCRAGIQLGMTLAS